MHAVTEQYRKAHPQADEEELEFLATAAADARSAELAQTAGERRATVAVDVEDPASAVPVSQWAAVFIDDLQWHAVSELDHVQ
jgi:hypothetical protein